MSKRWPNKPEVLENIDWDEVKDQMDGDLWCNIVNHIADVECLLEATENFVSVIIPEYADKNK